MSRVGYFDSLGELDLVAELCDVHHEELVVAGFFFIGGFCGFSHELVGGSGFEREFGGYGSVAFQELGIDVPSFVHFGCGDEVELGVGDFFGFEAPVDWVDDALCLGELGG